MTVKIDYFSITVHADEKYMRQFWRKHFAASLGDLVPTDMGGRGFKRKDTALLGAQVYYEPAQDDDFFFHVEIKGQACTALAPSVYIGIIRWLDFDEVVFKVTRLDLAFDELFFTPTDFYNHLLTDNDILTFANRRTIKFHIAPFEARENGEIGTSGVYLGSRKSERMIRVYDLHGFTRLELQLKQDRADAIARHIFISEYPDWEQIAKSHLRQFVDFPSWDYWIFFISSVVRSDLIIASARLMTLEKSKKYIEEQVSPTLSVLQDVLGEGDFAQYLERTLEQAKDRPRTRYKALLEASHRNIS